MWEEITIEYESSTSDRGILLEIRLIEAGRRYVIPNILLYPYIQTRKTTSTSTTYTFRGDTYERLRNISDSESD